MNKSIHTLLTIFEQSCLLNMKANIKGNKDPVRKYFLLSFFLQNFSQSL